MRNALYVLADWQAGLANYQFWWRFGLLDVKLRYRRTLLGPFWLTLSFGVSVAALTLVYSMLFKVTAGTYFTYLIVGLAVWGLISTLLIEGCKTFGQLPPSTSVWLVLVATLGGWLLTFLVALRLQPRLTYWL